VSITDTSTKGSALLSSRSPSISAGIS
jgi:hypothetical protein